MEKLLNWLVVWWMDAIAPAKAREQEYFEILSFYNRLLERADTGELWGDRENAELR